MTPLEAVTLTCFSLTFLAACVSGLLWMSRPRLRHLPVYVGASMGLPYFVVSEDVSGVSGFVLSIAGCAALGAVFYLYLRLQGRS